jgi:hypothetical protein
MSYVLRNYKSNCIKTIENVLIKEWASIHFSVICNQKGYDRTNSVTAINTCHNLKFKQRYNIATGPCRPQILVLFFSLFSQNIYLLK